MKKHYLAIGAITATTLLAGCDLGDMIGLNNLVKNQNIRHHKVTNHQIKHFR